jgi:hypothetical protein
MAVSLIKREHLTTPTATPIPVLSATFTQHEEFKCAHCPTVFDFGFSAADGNCLKQWRPIVQDAINKDHSDGHRLMALTLPLTPVLDSFTNQ